MAAIKKFVNTHSLAEVFYDSLVDGDDTLDLSLDDYRDFLKDKERVNPLTQDDIDNVALLYLEYKDFVGDANLSEGALSNPDNWQNYLPLLRRILQLFEQFTPETPALRSRAAIFLSVPLYPNRH